MFNDVSSLWFVFPHVALLERLIGSAVDRGEGWRTIGKVDEMGYDEIFYFI